VPDRDDDLRQADPAAGGPDEAALAIVARHALHDEELVAALAAGALESDDDVDERARARSLVHRCPACRAVQDDVAAIGASLHAAALFTTKAPRDFRLTVDDAHRLGGTVITRGPLAAFRRALLGVARPLGASVAALGLVGILVGGAAFGAAGLASGPAEDQSTGGALSPSSAVVAPGATGVASSTLEVAVGSSSGPKVSERQAEVGPDGVILGPAQMAPDVTGWLLWASVLAIVLGAALFIAGVRAARDRAPGSGSH
jgi:hypothetical protein